MPDNKHLKKHHDTWVFSRRVPKEIQHLYLGKSHITQSLQTSSIKVARLKRDRINGELASQAQGAYSADRMKFKSYVEEVRPYTGALKDNVCSLSYDDVLPRNEIAKTAYDQEVYGIINHSYTITIKEALSSLLSNRPDMSSDDRSKKINSLKRFLTYHSASDLALADITKKQVVEYIQHLGGEYAVGTIRSHLSRLKALWTHAYQMGEIKTSVSPFCDHDLSRFKGEASKPKQLFSKEQLNTVLNESPMELRDFVKVALFTGARLSELCQADVEEIEGVKCLIVRKGKTASATRVIPIAPQIQDIELPFKYDSKTVGRTFSRFKVAQVTTDTTRSFHSLRNHFITASERAGVKEFDVCHIVGHKTGNTMSYGHYARHDIKRLAKTVQQTANQIETEWL
ncbi:hypothetical protein tloyanaT_04030 [Thalassotalea loyana]|uniref:Integrase n=1 Tax=Thalassotalea loyana TaxID=280483 RepID=A0ABQ6HB69_9GAMM|nr:DUF6538 domain-containing protein [Thalassotalea loyana]GLX84151.1 hypothetical protein tloyanaT_04030 [Thalassotalea loyana]